MPTTSDKQERFMQAVAHSPKFAKKAGVPQSVGKEFTAKEGGLYAAGGSVKGWGMARGSKKCKVL